MRTVIGAVFLLLGVFASSDLSARVRTQYNVTGAWSVVWDGDSANTNRFDLTYKGGSIGGTYINDSQETCAVTGTLSFPTSKVHLKVQCSSWDIVCDGSFEDAQTITGNYLAYGKTPGTFRMARGAKKPPANHPPG